MRKLPLFLVLALAGCGGPKEDVTIKNPDGSEVNIQKGTVDVKGPDGSSTHVEDGKATIDDGKGTKANLGTSVSETELGQPFYPGATPKENGGSKIDNEKETNYLVFLETTDSPEKVMEFYKDKFKTEDRTTMNSGGNSIVGGVWNDGCKGSVAASTSGGKTEITITLQRKKG